MRFHSPAMNLFKNLPTLTLALAAGFFASCATQKPTPVAGQDGRPVNPHPPGSYQHFISEPTYPKSYNYWMDEELLSRTNKDNSHIEINLATQRGFLMNGDRVVIDYPVTSGRASQPTPKGEFRVLEQVVDKRSNKYGRIYDADGKLVKTDADVTSDEVPEGGRFEGASMAYWMRMTWDGVGHHVGPLRRVPISRSCIRGPAKVMPLIYSKTKLGTPIIVY
jgi:hypothetical protein